MKLKVKIITGFRKDQKYTIDGDEAHKAYYLFMNPDKRGIFSTGAAIKGSNIQGIEPDYHATMGWNESHVLDSDDWNEINKLGVKNKTQLLLQDARDAVKLYSDKPEMFALPLSKITNNLQING